MHFQQLYGFAVQLLQQKKVKRKKMFLEHFLSGYKLQAVSETIVCKFRFSDSVANYYLAQFMI